MNYKESQERFFSAPGRVSKIIPISLPFRMKKIKNNIVIVT